MLSTKSKTACTVIAAFIAFQQAAFAAPVPVVQFAQKSFPTAAVSKMLQTNTPAFIHLAGIRHQCISLNQCGMIKARAVKKQVEGLTPAPSTRVSSVEDLKASDQPLLSEPEIESMELSTTYFEPVSYRTLLPAANFTMEQLPGCTSWHNSNSSPLVLESGIIAISDGESILCVKNDTSIVIDDLTVNLRPGSTVLLRHQNKLTRVVNLYDSHRDDINIQFSGKSVYLRPGQECIIAGSEQVLKACKRQDGSARRCSAVSHDANTGNTVAICELSIPSLLKYHPLLGMLYKSNEKQEKELVRKMLKMSACLAHFSKSSSAYSGNN